MKSRPLIAITPSYTKEGFVRMNSSYLNAVWGGGGNPVFVAYTTDPAKLAEYAELFDGFLFAGGVDVDPKYYGEDVKFDSVEICPERDDFELSLFDAVLQTGKPVLGICRGIQLLNVALGGSLYQHLEQHSQTAPGRVPTQRVTLQPDTPLSSFANGKSVIEVNTFHHQAVKDAAPSLRVIARSDDGICEALWLPEHRFFLGVQWHPELLIGDSVAAGLFGAFAEASRG